MSESPAEVAVGAVTLAVAAGFFVYAAQMTGFGQGGTEAYPLTASFESAEVSIEDGADVSVRANDMLGSVFRNLLQNAILHNDAATPEVTISSYEKPDSVVVSVVDNGPGIPPEKREEIFERGKRGQASNGSGLGLYLVETLVDHCGGDVWVEVPESRAETGPLDDDSPDESGGSVEGTVFCVELEKAS